MNPLKKLAKETLKKIKAALKKAAKQKKGK